MVLSAPVKALALVVFLAAIASATYAVREVVGDTVEAQLISVFSPRALLNATPGHDVTYAIVVANRDSATRDAVVALDGIARGESVVTTVRGGSNATVFVTVSVPEDASVGDHGLDASVRVGERVVRERDALVTLRVFPPGVGFGPTSSAQATYTGRLSATGRVFNTNDAALIGHAFPKTDSYRFSQGALTIASLPRPNVVQGIYEGVQGMQVGESRTLGFPPERGYGPATEEDSYPRDDTLLRNLTLRNDAQRVSRQEFDDFANGSEQLRPGAYQEGDLFTLEQNGDDWPYRIERITNASVEYKLVAKVGDELTIYPFWRDGSVVTAINDTHVSFRTTPKTAPGDKITVKQFWPLMSELKEHNETHVVIRNTPPQGYTFTAVSAFGQPREATVREVNEERILVALPSSNPLAGKDLTFDVTIQSLS